MTDIRQDSLPDNPAWHKTPELFEAYCAGRNDMLSAGYRKVPEEEDIAWKLFLISKEIGVPANQLRQWLLEMI